MQERVLNCDCDEILFGGAKGGGKSDVLLFGALRFIDRAGYKALIIRRTFPRLKEIIDRSMVFTKLGGRYNRTEKIWRFPSGAQIIFGHCENEGDELNYQGHQYHYIGFDQVEEFTENMFNIISACGRKTDDIPILIRCTANPGGVGRLWVKRRWIDGKKPHKAYACAVVVRKEEGKDRGRGTRDGGQGTGNNGQGTGDRGRGHADPSETGAYAGTGASWTRDEGGGMGDGRQGTGPRHRAGKDEREGRSGKEEVILRWQVFIPSKIYDNKILMNKNPEYLAFLQNLPEKFKKMYLEGDFSYEDEPDQLISYEMLNKNSPQSIPPSRRAGVQSPFNSPQSTVQCPKSINTGEEESEVEKEEMYLGVDVARFGDDSTEIAVIKGNTLIKIETHLKKDINQIAQILIKKIREERIRPENIGVDTVGLGAGVFDIIKSNGYKINEISSGSAPVNIRGENYRFRNLRCQMHWHFREQLREGKLFISCEDREFEEEVLSIKYEISSEKMITIESKEEIKKRIGRSTNKHDAVVYAAFIPVLKRRLMPHIY